MKAELFDELAQSIREGGSILRVEKPASRTFRPAPPSPTASINVAGIRASHNLTQSQFAELIGVTTATVRRWEQNGRVPGGPARVLLHIAEKHPQMLRAATSGFQVRRPGARRQPPRRAAQLKSR